MVELKPCPFCGGKAILKQITGRWAVHCENQCAGTRIFNDAKRAIDAWNTRVGSNSEAMAVEPLTHDENGVVFEFVHYPCPSCGDIIDQNRKGQTTGLYRPKYCHECGQRLLWEDE